MGIYLRMQQRSPARFRITIAAFVLTVVLGAGSFVAITGKWLPYIEKAECIRCATAWVHQQPVQ